MLLSGKSKMLMIPEGSAEKYFKVASGIHNYLGKD